MASMFGPSCKYKRDNNSTRVITNFHGRRVGISVGELIIRRVDLSPTWHRGKFSTNHTAYETILGMESRLKPRPH